MKNHYFLVKGWCLVVTFLMTIPFMGQATETSRLFKARRQTNLVRLFSTQLTHSDTIPLQNMSAIYALSIDATITQPREASFVRIVLEDTEGHDYLVAESDRFRNDTALVLLMEYCEETARLDGVTPVRLKCYLAGDATLTVTGIHASDQIPIRGENTSMETASAIKEAQVEDIVNRINEYNNRHGKLWRAGLNNWALKEYNSDIKGEGDAYIANFKYYTDGIYEMGERPTQRSNYTSPYVDNFDWRNRHGKNWVTKVKDQGNTSNCSVFSTIGMTETATNLFFNDTINLNLSEQCLLNYITPPNYALDRPMQCGYILNYGVIDSISLPYTGLIGNSSNPRPYGNECISFDSYHCINKPYFTNNQFMDTLKWNLIHHGPGSWGYNYPQGEYVYGTLVYRHYMTLVGYGTVHAGDTCTFVTDTSMNTYTMPDSIAGYTYWVFKDSYGNTTNPTYKHNGFRYVIFYDTSKMDNNAFFIDYPIYRRDYQGDIICEDKDGDGYFNWGIGPRPDNKLPSWAEQEEDGDDSNRFKGAMNEYGYLADVNYSSPTIGIDHNMTDTELIDSIGCSRFLRRHIRIDPGVTFTIQGSFAFYSGKRIYMNNLSNLVIDGGSLVDPTLYKSAAGGKVVIKNGGKIVCHKKSSFVLPDEITMEMDEGSIFE